MIAIADYGLGNIKAFENIFRSLNIKAWPARHNEDFLNAEKIILPGVGAFDWAMKLLTECGLDEILNEQVLVLKKPILGVCVGMQIMANSSEEGLSRGLGWIDSVVVKISSNNDGLQLRLPHMGWNKIENCKTNLLFDDIYDSEFYFLHSYIMKLKNNENQLSKTSYGNDFTSSVNKENIYGTQFHPEKSHNWGIKLLENFANKI